MSNVLFIWDKHGGGGISKKITNNILMICNEKIKITHGISPKW